MFGSTGTFSEQLYFKHFMCLRAGRCDVVVTFIMGEI